MRIDEMQYFVAVVDTKSINQASKKLFMTQPALSRAIASIEKELGMKLLNRSKYGITPTKEGQKVYEDCGRILRLYNECTGEWEALSKKTSSVRVQIVALPMACNTTMSAASLEITQAYPYIELEIYERQLGDVLETAAGMSHAIVLSHYNDKTKGNILEFAKKQGYELVPLFDDEYRLYINSESPCLNKALRIEDLRHFTLASYSDPNVATKQEFSDAGLGGESLSLYGKVVRLSNRHAMTEMVANHEMVALSAVRMAQDDVYRKVGKISPLTISGLSIPMTYFILKRKNATSEEELVANTLIDSFKKLSSLPQ